MKVIRVEGTPIGFDDYEPDELEQDELDIIERMGADEIRYCYAINEDFGDYDGAGDALIRINGFWRYASLRHGSFDRPTDNMEMFGFQPTIEGLLATLPPDLRDALQPLANAT